MKIKKEAIKLLKHETKRNVLLRFLFVLLIFLGILNRLFGFDKEKCLHCGAGCRGYAISTSGTLVACPIMNNIKNFEAGDLKTNSNELKKISIKDFNSECENCRVRNICGGRCLYWRSVKLWPQKEDKIICDSIKHLIFEIKKKIPEIQNLLKKKIILKKDLEYERYFGPEIIP